ncbi:MAG TPA: M56 family metallopeptidase [Puia sp.]|nr:M56 family metallopeptidase [Puia sp.]
MPVNNVFGEKIFKHELIHIKQKHTYDKLFIQLSTCVFWINPFFWLIQKELNTILEFIADEASVEEGDTETFAIMLLQTYNDGVYLNPISSFLNSSIKRRLNMITASKKVQYSYLRRVCGLPILLLVTILVSAKIANAQTDPKLMPNASVKITKTKVLKVNDSLVNVTINYVDEQEKPTSVNLVTTYAKNDSANEAVIYDGETGERREVSQKETKEIVKQIIQNPPAGIIYYIDNKEFSSEEVKKLAPEKIKTINVFGKEEAVKKFGARAKFGAIVFTTN